MRRTDALTTFLSGVSLLILGPFILVFFLQWWVIILIALAITGVAIWSLLLKDTETSSLTDGVAPEGSSLSPELIATIRQTLAEPFCSSCGEKHSSESAAYCSYCGEQRSYKPLSTLLDIDAE